MNDEDGFLQKFRDNPADDTTRLVYADWLDERGDPVSAAKAEFIRTELRLPTLPTKKTAERSAAVRRLQELATTLDVSWLAVVSQLDIENCGVQFSFVCPKKWEQLFPTDSATVRFCAECAREVHYCDTITVARQHAWSGDCVAVDLGVVRREGDLAPLPLMRLGWAPYTAAERELMRPDPVSQAREEAKRKQRGDADVNS
ncbi:Uncharacterized protein OS=Rhodopirellula europaea 6C GN=RE6C_05401 PE=4 SV=1 [Gemmataceae bacterium]|nr:Uncharacterized protein OS=Rhodopirellula europaea 6C GN=RE6C_05401 PE=4 SV=1 [Gemmataceae bacterium]VTU01364.1 Uncharacterized protein OS=Rhodopirellula europaea 6C GN=RE6C_05401 PE=4 SV=1 [Gemmataceae bacterium]